MKTNCFLATTVGTSQCLSRHFTCHTPFRKSAAPPPLLRCLLFCLAVFFAQPITAQTLYLLTSDDQLATASATNPAASTTPLPVTGVTPGETLVAIDVRPQNQRLYALGINALADTGTVYHLAPETGVATPVGMPGSVAFVDSMGSPIDFPDPASASWSIDFNPTVDRIRVVTSSGLNLRLNPNNGAPIDGNAGVPGVNPDGNIGGATLSVSATAYTNSQPNTAITTQYTVDAATHSLYIQNPPNNGTQTAGQPITLAGAPLDFSDVRGFDIKPGVNAMVSNMPVAAGSAVLVATVAGVTNVYSLSLTTGQATLLGTPSVSVKYAAIQTSVGAAFALGNGGSTLLRFNPQTPGTTFSVAITGVAMGETLVGIDGRPQTGQFYGLGVNDLTDTATLYLIDPQTGAATVVGAVGSIAYVDSMGNSIDLPPPSAGYGIDFNPSVDRLRIITGTGLNLRANPNNGAPVDGDAVAAGINPDGGLNIAGMPTFGITATAYTNSFGQPIGVGSPTTQYSFDSSTATLYIQNPPNNGVLTMPLQDEVFDLGMATGFDIPSTVAVGVANEPAVGVGYVLGSVGMNAVLFELDLATAALTAKGMVGSGLASGLVVWEAAQVALADDLVTVTAGPTRFNPLANDQLEGPLTLLSVSDPTVLIDGRSLILPEGFPSSTFTYQATDGILVGTASVTVVQGVGIVAPRVFTGLLYDSLGDVVGWGTASITPKGVASVQLRGGVERVTARVTFPGSATTASTLSRFGNLTLVRNANGTVSVDLAALGGALSGTLRAAQPTTLAGKHHIALASIDSALPGGGTLVATVSKKGRVSLSGVLPDGLPFTCSTTLGDNGSFAFVTVINRGANPRGFLGGELLTADLTRTDVTGEMLYWKLPQLPRAKGTHLAGVDTILTANGSLFTGLAALPAGSGTLRLSGGNLDVGSASSVTVINGVPTTPTGALNSWTGVKPRVGRFSARVKLPGITKLVMGRGLYLPKSNTAWGYFPGTTDGGRIELSVP